MFPFAFSILQSTPFSPLCRTQSHSSSIQLLLEITSSLLQPLPSNTPLLHALVDLLARLLAIPPQSTTHAHTPSPTHSVTDAGHTRRRLAVLRLLLDILARPLPTVSPSFRTQLNFAFAFWNPCGSWGLRFLVNRWRVTEKITNIAVAPGFEPYFLTSARHHSLMQGITHLSSPPLLQVRRYCADQLFLALQQCSMDMAEEEDCMAGDGFIDGADASTCGAFTENAIESACEILCETEWQGEGSDHDSSLARIRQLFVL